MDHGWKDEALSMATRYVSTSCNHLIGSCVETVCTYLTGVCESLFQEGTFFV